MRFSTPQIQDKFSQDVDISKGSIYSNRYPETASPVDIQERPKSNLRRGFTGGAMLYSPQAKQQVILEPQPPIKKSQFQPGKNGKRPTIIVSRKIAPLQNQSSISSGTDTSELDSYDQQVRKQEKTKEENTFQLDKKEQLSISIDTVTESESCSLQPKNNITMALVEETKIYQKMNQRSSQQLITGLHKTQRGKTSILKKPLNQLNFQTNNSITSNQKMTQQSGGSQVEKHKPNQTPISLKRRIISTNDLAALGNQFIIGGKRVKSQRLSSSTVNDGLQSLQLPLKKLDLTQISS